MCAKHGRNRLLDVIEQRLGILEQLRDEATDKRTLVETLDCSRSTVDRGVRELESSGLVDYEDGEYRLTTFGRLAVDEYREFDERIETLDRLKPALTWLPVKELGFDLGCLHDAEVVVSTPNDPYAPANRHADVMADAASFRGLLPGIGLSQMEVGRTAISDGQRQRVVVEQGVADAIRDRSHYAERVTELLDSGRVEISVYDGSLPYFLGLYDETVHVGVENADGIPQALVETDAEEVWTWAESVYADYERQARTFA